MTHDYSYMLNDPALRHGEGIIHISRKKGILELESRKSLRAGRYVVVRRLIVGSQTGRLRCTGSFNIFQGESREFIATLREMFQEEQNDS